MSRKPIKYLMRLLLVTCIISLGSGIAQNSRIDWFSFNMGFENPIRGNDQLKSVVGQQLVERTGHGDTWIHSGFLADTLLRGPVASLEKSEVITEFRLEQNFPNPFNPVTTIRFSIPNQVHVSLAVYDILGKEVLRLVDDEMSPGFHVVRLEVRGLSSGVYFYRLRAGAFVQIRKLMVLK